MNTGINGIIENLINHFDLRYLYYIFLMCHRCQQHRDLLLVNDEEVCLDCIKLHRISTILTHEQERKLIADCLAIHHTSMINSISFVSFIRLYGFFVYKGIRYYTIGDLVFYDSPLKPVARLFYNHLLLWF